MLNEQELQTYRELLQQVEDRIRGDYQHLTDEALENFNDSRSPQHLAELGTDAYEREFSLRFAESDQQLLEEIRLAVARIENGTYGLCEACVAAGKSNSKAAIPKTRLKEIPYARNCVTCEREREREARDGS
ncbi:MAG: TraR/DksA family transcriptional regulator [Planctomycetaceae bacterium]